MTGNVPSVSKETGTLVVAEELVDHKSSSGAKRAAGCATSPDREITVELDAVVLVVLVVVLLPRRPPSCLPRRVNTPASFTDPVNKTRHNYFSPSLQHSNFKRMAKMTVQTGATDIGGKPGFGS